MYQQTRLRIIRICGLTTVTVFMQRRSFLAAFAASLAVQNQSWAQPLLAGDGASEARIGAAWRGPRDSDPRQAGVLIADWDQRQLRVGYSLDLPSRCHGLTPMADGGLLVLAARPGSWLLRCDDQGRVVTQVQLPEEKSNARLNGHVVAGRQGEILFTTETDLKTGKGRIGVRDRETLRKLDEWDSHGLEPHQLLVDHEGHLVVANGGIARTLDDRKVDLDRMDSSLVRLDARSGRLLGQWKLPDQRLSLRHMAWADDVSDGPRLLGIAMQAEHEQVTQRSAAPILAVFDGQTLTTPTTQNDGVGYAGDIASACDGGFTLSSHQAGKVYLWHPSRAADLREVVQFKQSYALTRWHDEQALAGVLVATAYGLVRWHAARAPIFLSWPVPMALDNHWVWMNAC